MPYWSKTHYWAPGLFRYAPGAFGGISLLRTYLYFFNYVQLWVNAYPRGPEVSDLLALELQTGMKSLMRVLGIELWSSQCWVISPAPCRPAVLNRGGGAWQTMLSQGLQIRYPASQGIYTMIHKSRKITVMKHQQKFNGCGHHNMRNCIKGCSIGKNHCTRPFLLCCLMPQGSALDGNYCETVLYRTWGGGGYLGCVLFLKICPYYLCLWYHLIV